MVNKENIYEVVLSSTPTAVMIYANNKILLVNNLFLEIFRTTSEKIIGTSPLCLVHPDFKEVVEKRIKASLENGEKWRPIEEKLIRGDGSHFYGEASTSPIIFNGDPASLVVLWDVTKRKVTEEKLLKSEALLKEAQEVAHIGHWEYDIVNNKLQWSDEIYRIFGFEPQVFQSTYEIFKKNIHPDDRDIVVSTYSNSLKNKTPYNIKHRIKLKDGAIKFVREKCNTVFDIDGTPLRSLGTVQDITELVNREQAIKESEEKFRAIVENTEEIIFMIDTNGIFTLSEGKGLEKIELKPGEVVGSSAFELYKNSPIMMEGFKKALSGITNSINNDAMGQKYKTWYSPHRDNEGNIIGLIGMAVNITEQENRLLQNIKLSNIVEQSPITVVITDLDGNIEYANPKFEETTGYSREEAIGQNPRILKSGNQNDLIYSDLWQKISNGDSWEGLFNNKKKNGELYWEESVIAPIKDFDGRIINYVALKVDVSKRIKLEERLKEHYENLENTIEERTKELAESEKNIKKSLKRERELSKLKGKFISTVTHEFRTPLTSIYSSVELLEKFGGKWEKSEISNYYNTIKNSVENLTSIVEKTLEYSRIESGGIVINKEKLNLKKMCKNTVSELTPLLKKNQILASDCQYQSEYFLDENILRIIMTNLVSNAIKYSGEGKTIEIRATENNESLLIEVADNGIGIDEKDLKNVFNPYFRSSNVQNEIGSGLGLAITKSYISLLGGTIKIESKINEGTKIILKIPV